MHIFFYKKDLNFFLTPLKEQGKTIGFVPTMGALHEGHLSLVNESNTKNDITVVSIFVNKTQFNNPADYEKYPRMPDQDFKLLDGLAQVVFYPSHDDLYEGDKELLKEKLISPLNLIFEGKFRPGHFAGVITVVHKLFDAVQPHRAYFGLKDYQQVLVIKKMSALLHKDIEIVALPTIRMENGLAMSSRNLLLSPENQQKASIIYRTFQQAKVLWKENQSLDSIIESSSKRIESAGIKVEYFAIVDAETLGEASQKRHKVMLFAGYLGEVRLIDNELID